jgi:hypothetical protein
MLGDKADEIAEEGVVQVPSVAALPKFRQLLKDLIVIFL